MNPLDATKYNQYWNQIQQGLTAEQRYNYKLYDDIEGSLNYKINVTKAHTVNKKGEPGTITRKIDNNGIIQDRIYDSAGDVVRDIDFAHSGLHNHFFPHVHIWEKVEGETIRK